MSPSLSELPVESTSRAAESYTPDLQPPRIMLVSAAWHSLLWLVVANAVGILIALLLLVPSLNDVLGDWTYGRWMPVHINLQLYGWCSLPLVMFLFSAYGVSRGPAARWWRPVLWFWSVALAVGAGSWLSGHSSGKLFLDWTGYSRLLFPMALVALWMLLCAGLYSSWQMPAFRGTLGRVVRVLGLLLLLAVPLLIYIASSPNLYPPINPDTGGPTGASQLEATLVIIAILLLLPFGISRRKESTQWPLTLCWAAFAFESLLCLGLGRADVSHHRPVQFLSLGSLLVWLPLMPIYYSAFRWNANTRRWRIAFLGWWSILIPTGWCLFLPGVLDHFKFTDGLVAHSLLAMAGFVSSLLIFAMVQMLGEDGWIFNTTWSFYLWQASVAAYVAIMFFAGWREGSNPSFTIVPGLLRNSLYTVRLLLGVLLFLASADWLRYASQVLQKPHVRAEETT